MLKRLFDVVAALAGLALLGPVIAIIAWQVRQKLGSPIFFRQVRPGKGGKPFEMVKFRTMTDAVDESGELLPDSERLTEFGMFLRSSSLDELPAFWNVLKGQMSIVGPRPLAMVYIPYYTPEEFRRHDVRPGITGLAQVSGRNNLSWEEKFEYDIQYVNDRSLFLDIKIIFLTVYKVFKSEGIGQGEERPINFHETRTKKYRW